MHLRYCHFGLNVITLHFFIKKATYLLTKESDY